MLAKRSLETVIALRRHFAPLGVLLVLGIAVLLAARPLLTAPFLDSYDGPLHLYRLFALDNTLRQGIVYPRTLLALAYGLGYPIYNYYPPLAGYVAETFHVLGLGFAAAIQGTFLLSIALGAGGAYLLGVELYPGYRETRLAGILSAIAYIFFPYFQIALYTRGALAEVLALALLPWVVWAVYRALRHPNVVDLLLVALLLAGLILTHSLTAVITAPFLIAFGLFVVWQLEGPARVGAIVRVASAGLLGLALSAFYWLPFVTELPLVQMGQGYDRIIRVFETNFFQPATVIQNSFLYEYGGPPTPLGLVAMGLATLAVVMAVALRVRHPQEAGQGGTRFRERGLVIFFGVVALLATLSMVEPARSLWLLSPLATLLQSVWRVTVLINLSAAVLIGALPILLPMLFRQWQSLANEAWLSIGATAVLALLLVIAAAARLNPTPLVLPANAFTLGHLARFEVNSGSLGTTTFGEYLPIDVTTPDLSKFQAATAARPNPMTVQLLAQRGMDWMFETDSAAAGTLALREFFFPNWRATVDDQPVKVGSRTKLGLLSIAVPAGVHRISISAQATTVQQVATVISGLALSIAVVLIAWTFLQRERNAWVPAIAALTLLFVAAASSWLAITARPAPIAPIQTTMMPGLDAVGLRVADADLDGDGWTIAAPSDVLSLEMFWHVVAGRLQDSPITVRLVDASGKVVAQRAQLPYFGTAPQSSWMQNEIVGDHYEVPLSADLARGRYQLEIGAVGQDFVKLGSVELGISPVVQAAPVPVISRPAKFGDGIELLGYESAAAVQPGETLPIKLYWQADTDIFQDYRESIQLLDGSGKLVAQQDGITGQGLNPTGQWLPGRTVVDQVYLKVPPDTRRGLGHRLVVVLYNLKDLQRLPVHLPNSAGVSDAALIEPIQIGN